ncbi:MAG: YdiY family protein [Limisphaerales bacterium]
MKLRAITTIVCESCLAAATAFADDAAPTNAPPKPPTWDVSAAAGLTLTRGNSKTLLGTANVLAVKKWELNELDFGADGVYGESSGVRSAEQLHGFGQYNRMFTQRFYGYFRVDGLYDGVADIDYRVTVGPGVGYYLIKATNTTFRAEFGPGYIYEQDHDDGHRSYMTLRFAERFEQKITAVAKIYESVEFLPQVDDFSNYIINSEAGVETAMSKKFSLLTYLQDWYHSDPAPGRLKNDVKLVSALKYKF